MKYQYLLVTLLSLLNLSLFAEESGRHFMTFYTSEQTGGHFQNWSVIQDDRGVMYIGNGYGILEYDGSTWRLIPNTNKSFATTFAKDSTGRIYVGCAAEFGYLEPDSKGDMQFNSLLDQIPRADRGFTSVNRVTVIKEGILFQARERIFLFTPVLAAKGEKESWTVKIWRPENMNILISDYADNTLYALDNQKGLMKLVDGVLQSVPGSEKMLQTRARLLISFPGHPGEYLIYRVREGFFLYDGKTFTPWKTEADDQIIGTYSGMKYLRDGNIAVGTSINGLFILDQAGRLKLHLSTANGLLSNVIKLIYPDYLGNLWLAMDGGVGMIEYDSNTRYFRMEGGGTTDVNRFRGKIYAATLSGIYYLDPKDTEFRIVKGIPNGYYSFLTEMGGHLISANLYGIVEIRESDAKIIFSDPTAEYGFSFIYPISSDSARFLGGSITGLYLLKQDPKSRLMTVEKKFRDIFEYIFFIRESERGVFWIGTYDAGVIRLTFKNNDLNHPVIEKFGPEHGLSPGTVMVNMVNGKVVFSTSKGFYKYIPATNRFEPDMFYKEMKLGINPSECPVVSDKKGNIWADGGKDLVFYRRLPAGTFRMEKGSFSRFFGHMVNIIYPENDSTTWLGLSGSVVRISSSAGLIDPKPWNTMIRSVRITGDRPVYMGGGIIRGKSPDGVKIPQKTNDISFQYSGLSYIMPEYNEFSIKLDGYDRNWSGWMRDTRYNYTNLPPGHYVFRVKCRNIIGQEGSEAAFAFTILTPWYLTIWVFLGYIILATAGIYCLVLFRTRKLRQRSRELEKIVEARTAQIQEQKNNVEQLSKIGKDITSSLSLENIIRTVYENVNNLMDASVFTIGLHKPEEESLEFPATIEKGELLSAFSIPLSDEYRLAVWCFNNRKEVVINNYEKDYGRYVGHMAAPIAGETPESVLYLPLWNKDKVIGVISAQSFSKNAYSDYHLNMLRNLATYSAIAMENADAYHQLAILLDELRAAQDRLVTQSKLAALGELTAGISHEIQNPLNFVNNFSEISSELMDELKSELEKGNQEEVNSLIHDIIQNLDKIIYHGKRADSIVKSMLQHSLGSTGQKQPTDINNLADEFLRLAYHGLRAKDKSFQTTMLTDFDTNLGKINVVSQDIGRVVLNLISNAFYAVTERKKLNQPDYEPTVWVSTKKVNGKIRISVKDNGTGITNLVLDKIFQPFFTTKPTGEGTGLGLSLAYDIVTKEHRGELQVETKEGEGSTFTILLPC